MKKLIFLLVLLTTASYGADYHSPYDPGAARKNLGNVTPATGRAALGLGTMAAEAATDYVATDTFTGHTGATGSSVHGLGTISTVNSPVPVANGGTGKTTAAEALAALGGASLNGSSTVDFSAQNLSASGHTTLTTVGATSVDASSFVGFVYGWGLNSGLGDTLVNSATTTVTLPISQYSGYEIIITSITDGGIAQPTYLAYTTLSNSGMAATEVSTPDQFDVALDTNKNLVITNTSGLTLYVIANLRRVR